MHAREEKSALRNTMVKKDFAVKIPKMRKTPATSRGYTGVSQAVGPVSLRNGELNPFPVASEYAMLPVSCSNDTGPITSRGILRS
jgi:hypothetical protein